MKTLVAVILVAGGAFAAAACSDDPQATTGTNATSTASGGGEGGAGGSGEGGKGGSGQGGEGGSGQGGQGGQGGGGNPVVPSKECLAAGQAICDKLNECAPFFITIAYPDLATCAERSALSCQLDTGLPGSGLDAMEVQACADAIGPASCDDLFAGDIAACAPQSGTVPNGSACGSETQCQSKFCDVDESGTCGTCKPTVPDGGSCAMNGDACEPPLACAEDQTCATKAKSGEICGMDKPCVENLACSVGICGEGGKMGDICSPMLPCATSAGLNCNLMTNMCEPFAVADVGQACGFAMGKITLCKGGATCSANDVCVAPAKDGEACGGAMDVGCLSPAKCTNDVCTVPDLSTCN
jgi:hypothetical protein